MERRLDKLIIQSKRNSNTVYAHFFEEHYFLVMYLADVSPLSGMQPELLPWFQTGSSFPLAAEVKMC